MKCIFLNLLFIVSFSVIGISQKISGGIIEIHDTSTLVVQYLYSHKFDTAKTIRVFKEDMLLVITPGVSFFTPLKRYFQDSIDMGTLQSGSPSDLTMIDTRNRKSSVLPDMFKLNNSVTSYHKIYNNYGIQDSVSFQWTLVNEAKQIEGISVNKATTNFRGRNYEAWYAPEIPLNNGPWKFNGLPGLILEVKDNTGSIGFTYVGIYSKNKTPVIKNYHYLVVSKKEIEETINNYVTDPIAFFKAQTGITDMKIEGFQPTRAEKPRITILNPTNPIEIIK